MYSKKIIMAVVFLLILLSCKNTKNFTGIWISKDSSLYKELIIEISENGKVIMSNLPQSVSIETSGFNGREKTVYEEQYFDTTIKEGFFDKEEKRIVFENFSKEEMAYIVYNNSLVMEISFNNGTLCRLEKKE